MARKVIVEKKMLFIGKVNLELKEENNEMLGQECSTVCIDSVRQKIRSL